jgi:hypothetical protein
MTRKSGFSVQASVEVTIERVDTYSLPAGSQMTFYFEMPPAEQHERIGFGGWFAIRGAAHIAVEGGPGRKTIKAFDYPNWSKVGSQWIVDNHTSNDVTFTIQAQTDSSVAVYGMRCGVIEHEHYDTARAALLTNMHQFAPEANTYVETRTGEVTIRSTNPIDRGDLQVELYLKSCNRCGRFLPINVKDERAHLSYSNHCVAPHRRPCGHSGFGRIKDAASDDIRQFEVGFQLECRFCKKFEVNAAHNPQRTTAQMKEDAQRRRAFELLLENLYEGSDQLRYRHATGRELANDIYERFDGRCYKCGTALASPRDMHLDHTRPLALLWPLDETATALCPTCNSEKRDRPPSEFYTPEEREGLSELTGLPMAELEDPSPNMGALGLLRQRSEWFCNEFLQREELQEVRDGKRAADLLIKALDKALARVPGGHPYRMSDLCQ